MRNLARSIPMSAKLIIDLEHGDQGLQLATTTFIKDSVLQSVRGSRGKGRETGAFRWTKAVKALTVLCCGSSLNQSGHFVLRGEGHSLASSIDYATSRAPLWLTEMFGFYPNGIPVAKLLIQRQNPERKTGGDVIVRLNQHILKPADITVTYQGSEVTGRPLLDLLNKLIKNLVQAEDIAVFVEKDNGTSNWIVTC